MDYISDCTILLTSLISLDMCFLHVTLEKVSLNRVVRPEPKNIETKLIFLLLINELSEGMYWLNA